MRFVAALLTLAALAVAAWAGQALWLTYQTQPDPPRLAVVHLACPVRRATTPGP